MEKYEQNRYPVPAEYPEYREAPEKVHDTRRISVYALLDSVFIIVALVLSLWLAGLLLATSFTASYKAIFTLILFWIALAYFFLPRLHQLFTLFYVPDYFIGRSKTRDGVLGDPVNLAFDGDAEDIHAAMQRAGWTLADPITLRSSAKIIISSIFRRSYKRAPVSDLYLFGRAHDFAYQQEVDGNASRRHHVRFWKVPEGWVLPGGHHADWLAAGTYDKSVGLSIFTFQVTHKIDENIDLERDYIVDTLRYTDPEIKVDVIEDFSTAYHHRNGGGDRVRTDGNLPVILVEGAHERFNSTDEAALTIPTRKRPGDHGVPPPSLLITGGLVLIHLLAMGSLWWSIVGDGVKSTFTSNWDTAITVGVVTAAPLIELILWTLMIARRRWARIGLMLFASLVAVRSLVLMSDDPTLSFSTILVTMFAVLVVLIVSGDDARTWVSKNSEDTKVIINPRLGIT